MIPNPANGILHDIINMREDIAEIKQSQREMRGELTTLVATITNQWRERDREMAVFKQDYAIFKTRVYTIAGMFGTVWTVGTFLAIKFL